jgi:hypothetical protein
MDSGPGAAARQNNATLAVCRTNLAEIAHQQDELLQSLTMLLSYAPENNAEETIPEMHATLY